MAIRTPQKIGDGDPSLGRPTPRDAKFKIGWGGLAPGFPNYWGGKIAPQISNIGGGQDFENPNISSA